MKLSRMPVRAWSLIGTVILVSVASALVAVAIAETKGIHQNNQRLMTVAAAKARTIEARLQMEDAATAVRSAFRMHDAAASLGETGTFVVARRSGQAIEILTASRGTEATNRPVADLSAVPVAPMHRALAGEIGTVETTDHAGKTLLAAFVPIANGELGVVAMIDAAEVRAPYHAALVYAVAAALALGLLGVAIVAALNKKVVLDLAKSRQSLLNAFEAIVGSLATTLDTRDPYTGGHQKRVSEFAAQVATHMGLDDRTVEGIRIGALIHDIGKIKVPFDILNRPGKLTDAEMAIIKEHPTTGLEIVKHIALPWPVDKIISQHHERVDGTGYPRGLKADQICIEAKIVAACDTLEAVTSHRPYRPRKPLREALDILQRGRGKSFDATVVDALIHLIDSGQLGEVAAQGSTAKRVPANGAGTPPVPAASS